jgi:hypothetical protein
MATITTIDAGDSISSSRSDINANFQNLNDDKIETSAIDTDTTLAANSDDKVPSQKAIKAYVDANLTSPVSSEVTTGTTHSLTTTANQRVVVIAKGDLGNVAEITGYTVSLKYNGVTKDTVYIQMDTDGNANCASPFTLTYTETPGAATQNITVETTGATLSRVVIMVLKIRI